MDCFLHTVNILFVVFPSDFPNFKTYMHFFMNRWRLSSGETWGSNVDTEYGLPLLTTRSTTLSVLTNPVKKTPTSKLSWPLKYKQTCTSLLYSPGLRQKKVVRTDEEKESDPEREDRIDQNEVYNENCWPFTQKRKVHREV